MKYIFYIGRINEIENRFGAKWGPKVIREDCKWRPNVIEAQQNFVLQVHTKKKKKDYEAEAFLISQLQLHEAEAFFLSNFVGNM